MDEYSWSIESAIWQITHGTPNSDRYRSAEVFLVDLAENNITDLNLSVISMIITSLVDSVTKLRKVIDPNS